MIDLIIFLCSIERIVFFVNIFLLKSIVNSFILYVKNLFLNKDPLIKLLYILSVIGIHKKLLVINKPYYGFR